MAKREQITGLLSGRLTGRRCVVAALLLAWIALVVIGAGQASANTNRFAVPDISSVLTWFMVAVLVCGLLLAPFVITIQRGKQEGKRPSALPFLIILFAMAVIFANLVDPQNQGDPAPAVEEPTPASTNSTNEPASFSKPARNSIVALLLVGAVAGAALLWTRRQLTETPGTSAVPFLESAIAPAVDLAADHLLLGNDPRASVLAAYASLETSLHELGKGRQLSETPTEHLTRVLAGIPAVAGPALQLGRLYEVARFSDLPISSQDQRLAAAALDRARQDLATTASVPA